MSVRCAALMAAALLACPAAAQTLELDAAAEVTNDLRERGISASGGDASLSATAGVTVGSLRAEARAKALRGSLRHGAADLGLELAASYRIDSGGLTLDAGAVANLFPDARGDWDYGEVFASARYLIGPVELGAAAFYAPDQASIGGDNLYLRGRARLSVPATPWSVTAEVGRSSGSVDDPARAARLRPDGSYGDWSVGAEWTRGPVTAGMRYGDTDIDRARVVSPLGDRDHNGARVTATLGVAF